MPAVNINCEFCNANMRRDAIGTHVVAKHQDDIIQLLLENYKDDDFSISGKTINKIMNFPTGNSNPLYSKMYADATYYFGLKPMFFLDDENINTVHAYVKSTANMDAHNKFMYELTSKITLKNIIDYNIQIQVKSPEFSKMKKEYTEAIKKSLQLEEELSSQKHYTTTLKETIHQLKNNIGLEAGESVDDIKKDLAHWKRSHTDQESIITSYKAKLDAKDEEANTTYYELRFNHSKEIDRLWEVEDTVKKENTKLKEENARIKMKIKEEAQKILDKEKAKKKAEKKKLKKAIKKAKALEQAEDSDSDSDSSDSD